MRPGDAGGEEPGGTLRREVRDGERLDRALSAQLGHRAAPEQRLSLRAYTDIASRSTGPAEQTVRAAQAGDAQARERLIDECLPRIASMARVYRSGHIAQTELLQEGVVGVLRALERFDPERGVPFWGYATWWVRQAMQQLVAELGRTVVLSDRALRQLSELHDADRAATAETGEQAPLGKLAARSGLDLEQVRDLLAVDRPARSLQEPARGGDGDIGTLGELLRDPLAERQYEMVLDSLLGADLHALLSGLSERERAVLRARYGLDDEPLSLRELASRMGISAERVRQIEQRALGKLASHLDPTTEPPGGDG